MTATVICPKKSKVVKPDRDLMRQHFAAIYDAAEGTAGVVMVCRFNEQGKPCAVRFFGHQDLDGMVDYAATLAERFDVYFQPNLIDPAAVEGIKQRHGRGKESEVCAVVGLLADADAEKPGAKCKYPPRAALERAIESRGVLPTLSINSGLPTAGLHLYDLFHEPLVIADERQRAQVKNLSQRWQRALAGRVDGYDLDATADLCRVLRPAGSINHKYDCLVTPAIFEPNRRYEPADFEARLPVTDFYDWGRQDSLALTDTGNAERFAQQHGQNVRYCYAWNKWLAWDGTRWKLDDTGALERMAKLTARSILREAAAEEDSDRRKALVKFARASESAARRDAMLKLVRSEPGIPVLPEILDTNTWLLNCQNGTIDLRTGQLRDHRREDLITKLVPVEFRPDAKAPTWLSFLDRIFASTAGLIVFVQRLLGYCLTGSVREQVLPIFHGKGSNGKSTLIGTMLELLGLDYAIKAAPDLVLLKKDAHPTERADLAGKRLVACIEVDEGRNLAEALVKDLTGGDKIRARRMREDFWQFDPTHKIILAVNHRPAIRGTDHAIWRRIRLVPFTVTIPDAEQDKDLANKLLAELPGILAWCVQGCLEWQASGLGEPEEVKTATEEYRADEDVLAGFLADCCVVQPGATARATTLYKCYLDYCDQNGEKPWGQRQFGRAMTDNDRFDRYTNNGTWYRGVGLLEDATCDQR